MYSVNPSWNEMWLRLHMLFVWRHQPIAVGFMHIIKVQLDRKTAFRGRPESYDSLMCTYIFSVFRHVRLHLHYIATHFADVQMYTSEYMYTYLQLCLQVYIFILKCNDIHVYRCTTQCAGEQVYNSVWRCTPVHLIAKVLMCTALWAGLKVNNSVCRCTLG